MWKQQVSELHQKTADLCVTYTWAFILSVMGLQWRINQNCPFQEAKLQTVFPVSSQKETLISLLYYLPVLSQLTRELIRLCVFEHQNLPPGGVLCPKCLHKYLTALYKMRIKIILISNMILLMFLGFYCCNRLLARSCFFFPPQKMKMSYLH